MAGPNRTQESKFRNQDASTNKIKGVYKINKNLKRETIIPTLILVLTLIEMVG